MPQRKTIKTLEAVNILMFMLISFSPKGRPKKRTPTKKAKPSSAKRDALQMKQFTKQIRMARYKFRGNYDGLLLYFNKMAVVAALERMGVMEAKGNKGLIEKVLRHATADFKNLIETGEELIPKHKLLLGKVLGARLEEFLGNLTRSRLLIFSIEEALSNEDKGKGFKG